MSPFDASASLRDPPVSVLLLFMWLLVVVALMVCIFGAETRRFDEIPIFYYVIRPGASIAPVMGALWVTAIVAPYWAKISSMQKVLLYLGYVVGIALCAWVISTVWNKPS